MGPIKFKLGIFLIPLIVLLIFFEINYISIEDLNDILTASIAFSSSSLGFLIAGVSLLQSSYASDYYNKLKQLGTDKKIIAWLMCSITYMFMLSAISLSGLFLSNIPFMNWYFDIWLALIIASVLSTFFIVVNFYIVFTNI